MVENVDYDSLAANETLLDSFKLACAEAIAGQAGEGISASDVDVTVIGGSVIVVGLIRVPDTVSVSTVSDNLGSFDSLADAVVQEVQAVPGIANVQTGEIGVIQTTTTTTTALGGNQAQDDTGIAGVGVVVIVLAIICFGGVCGGVLARMTRNAPRGGTPIEVFGKSPRNSDCRVTDKLKFSEHVDDGQAWASARDSPATPGGTRPPCDVPHTFLNVNEFSGAQSGLRSAAGQPESGPSQDLMVTSMDRDEMEAPDCSRVNGTDNNSAEGTGSTVDEVADDPSRMPSQ